MATIAAVHEQLSTEFWFSHISAALIWGCPVVGLDRLTHITQTHRPGNGRDRMLVRHRGALPATETASVEGFPVTSLERTMLDCALTMPPERALVIADAALRIGASSTVLADLLSSRTGHRGVWQARRVLAAADARAESPGESITRWAMCAADEVPPELQIEVVTRLGTFWLDLGWPESKVAVEFDGFVKYSGTDGSTAPEAVFAEKRRQDALEELGWTVIRVTWADLRDLDLLAHRIRSSLRRARARNA